MKALFINAVCGIRSTGRICTDLARKLETQGYEVKIAYSRETVPEQYQKYAVRIGNKFDVYWHALMTRLFDDRGYWSRFATKKFLKWADEYNPDLLWLHNIHDYVINIDMLFDWIKSRPNMQVKWTQHDCWAFTGHCAHFTVSKCEQWKTHCSSCTERTRFPHDSLINRCSRNYECKKKAFCGVKNMQIVVVSHWLENLVKQSFLGEYPIEVCYNRIDERVFKPTPSNFREVNGLENKLIVLGVATSWSKNKGLDVFKYLSEQLPDEYSIVLVGLSEKQTKLFNGKRNVLCLPRTNSADELAQIYTAADVFANPSREETFGLTTLEAIRCGTKAIVYKDTACEEIANHYGGVVVEQSAEAVKEEILKMAVAIK